MLRIFTEEVVVIKNIEKIRLISDRRNCARIYNGAVTLARKNRVITLFGMTGLILQCFCRRAAPARYLNYAYMRRKLIRVVCGVEIGGGAHEIKPQDLRHAQYIVRRIRAGNALPRHKFEKVVVDVDEIAPEGPPWLCKSGIWVECYDWIRDRAEIRRRRQKIVCARHILGDHARVLRTHDKTARYSFLIAVQNRPYCLRSADLRRADHYE